MHVLGIAGIQLDGIILILTGPWIAPVHIPEKNPGDHCNQTLCRTNPPETFAQSWMLNRECCGTGELSFLRILGNL